MMSRCNRIRRHVVTTFALFVVAIAPLAAGADDSAPKSVEARSDPPQAPGLGLQLNEPGAFQGYTLVQRYLILP